ncbi:MAG: DUF3052 family protein [Devosia sp.]|uniref:DUF3052 domain-containing protein n=1 Tax=Devosia sp. 66-22 TaxID=1895753 RepID=UPI00092734AC|nr:DUF3052 domain-containing protein [Devosia sp. 66-22]MBN9347473.1 DUF3052 family protein [Devosia sp.]OJX46466.1 MAG: DUF3052 domain-containing protein [Devosia sp. 66-22]
MSASTPTTGYSGTPLAQKLGLKDGQRVMFIALPPELKELRKSRDFIEIAEAGWETFTDGDPGYDVIHGFTASRAVLERSAKKLMRQIDRDGTIWISWPKKASKVQTDITEDTIREVVLPIGLVDVKVAAVSEIWSGLKLMIRKELR